MAYKNDKCIIDQHEMNLYSWSRVVWLKNTVMTSGVARVRAIDPVDRSSFKIPVSHSLCNSLQKKCYCREVNFFKLKWNECKWKDMKKYLQTHCFANKWRVTSQPCLLHFGLAVCIARVYKHSFQRSVS